MNRKRSRKLSKKKSKNKRSMKRSNSRKTSKRQSKRSSKRLYKHTYGFPGEEVELLGICVIDTFYNYTKVNIMIDILREKRILPEEKEINFCMLDVIDEDKEEKFFNCRINGLYGSENLSQVYNKKYDIILLDGCPHKSYITFYTSQNILQLEKNLKDSGYIVIPVIKPQDIIPENIMENEEGVKMKDLWLNTFRKVDVLYANFLQLHVYQKK